MAVDTFIMQRNTIILSYSGSDMAIAWSALKLVMTFLIAKTSGQCPADNIVIGPPGKNSGKVEVGSDGAEYVLLDEFDRLGIHFLAGCSGQQSEVVLRLANGTDWFILEQDPVRVDSKTLQLKPDVGYADLLALPQPTIIAVEVKGVPSKHLKGRSGPRVRHFCTEFLKAVEDPA